MKQRMKSQANENATIDSETEGNVKETTKAAPTEDISYEGIDISAEFR